MTTARLLYRLQQLDQETDAAHKAIVELESRRGESAELRQARQKAAEARQALAGAQRRQADAEEELQSVINKANAVQEQLYSGRVHNPRELQGLEEEAKSLSRRRDQLQDQVLEAMVAVEEAHNALDAAQRALTQAEAGWSAAQTQLEADLAQQRQRAERAAGERAALAARLSPQALALYDDLRRRKGPAPVARVRGGTCGGCGVTLPVALVSQARGSDEPAFCSSCGRLLFAE
jgi:hypothetical protein